MSFDPRIELEALYFAENSKPIFASAVGEIVAIYWLAVLVRSVSVEAFDNFAEAFVESLTRNPRSCWYLKANGLRASLDSCADEVRLSKNVAAALGLGADRSLSDYDLLLAITAKAAASASGRGDTDPVAINAAITGLHRLAGILSSELNSFCQGFHRG